MVVGLAWSNESRGYAGGSVATGRASHARLVRDGRPRLRSNPIGPPALLGVGRKADNLLRKKSIVTKSVEAMAGLSETLRSMKRFKDVRIGSWNVLSLYRLKALQMLLDQLEKYYVDITCVQEMRWIGSGTIEKKNWIFLQL